MFAGLAPARRRLAMTGLAGVAVLAVIVVALVVRHRVDATVRPVAQDRPGPVVLVPGYYGSKTSLQPLRDALRHAGRDVTVLTLVGNGTGDLRAQARRLATVVRTIRRRTGAPSVDVVGYSAGGVVARLWVRDDGGASVARRLVTVGSPNHGTDIAAVATSDVPGGCPAGCRQLAPDSDLLRGLNAGDETPPGPDFVSIWSESDEIVTPADSAHLDGALDVTVQSICGSSTDRHGDLPRDPVVIRFVALALGVAEPVRPSSNDCSSFSS